MKELEERQKEKNNALDEDKILEKFFTKREKELNTQKENKISSETQTPLFLDSRNHYQRSQIPNYANT